VKASFSVLPGRSAYVAPSMASQPSRHIHVPSFVRSSLRLGRSHDTLTFSQRFGSRSHPTRLADFPSQRPSAATSSSPNALRGGPEGVRRIAE
jgi:hypothetical protein